MALLREVEAWAQPLERRIAVGRPPMRGPRPMGAVDRAWLDRLHAPLEVARGIEDRVERFLAVTGAAPLAVGEPRVRELEVDEGDVELTYTEG